MNYTVLKSRIADHYENARTSAPAIDVRNTIETFLAAHSMQISDSDCLLNLEYQVRGELQHRVLAAHLGR